MKRTRHKGIRKQKREKENKKMCSRTPQEEVHRSESSQRLRENEFVRTYHSCELAYFNPSMTVLYICTPLARLNKGANAVVLEVNCFKVCLSAMMKSCVVVRVQCDDRSVPPLFHLSLSRRGGSLVLALFACFFVFFKGERRARERTRRSIFFFLDFFSLWQERGEEEEEEERVFLCFCPPPLPPPLFSFCSFSFSLSFSFERTKKEEQQLSL